MIDYFSIQPPEIRNKIYGMVFDGSTIYLKVSKGKFQFDKGKSATKRDQNLDQNAPNVLGISGLFLVNRQIHKEAMIEILGTKTFSLRDYTTLSTFVKKLERSEYGWTNHVRSVRYCGSRIGQFSEPAKRKSVFGIIQKLPNLCKFTIADSRLWLVGIDSEHCQDDQTRAGISAGKFVEEIEPAMKRFQKRKEKEGKRFCLEEFFTMENGDSQMVDDFIAEVLKLLKQKLGEV